MIILKSHGFKFSRPKANFYFDVSFLINPWRQKELRGADKKTILTFMEKQKEFGKLVKTFTNLICTYERLWPNETFIFAFCCSAGKFRSPAVVKAISNELKKKGIKYAINKIEK